MLIPVIIPVVFRLSFYFCLIFGVYQVVQFFSGFSNLLYILIIGFLWFILYPILLHIVCEVLIILSDMNDSLTDIKKYTNPQ